MYKKIFFLTNLIEIWNNKILEKFNLKKKIK